MSLILTSGFGCKLASKEEKAATKPVTLEYWRVFDDEDAFDEIIAKYKQLHPFVTIKYRKFRYEEYQEELLNAMAEDRGPDILSIHNTWIRKYKNKIEPMPESTTMAYPVLKGTIKKEVVNELRTTKSISLKDLKNNFVDTVYDDVVITEYDEDKKANVSNVYGLPLALDTLALFYNKDLFNGAGIATVPNFWDTQFQEAVRKLSKQNLSGEIIQSGIAFGGGENIERAADIVSVLMMQSGAQMVTDDNYVYFDKIPQYMSSRDYNPGYEALRFYIDFANPAKEVYCWNSQLENSIDLFSQGKLAMMLGYSYHVPIIKARSPKMNFSIATLPQIQGNSRANIANYWVETVSKKSKNQDIAWDFIQFATREEQAKLYLEETNKPTALRALVNEQIDDMEVGPFAEQVLFAKSWYRGYDPEAADSIMIDMINEALSGEQKLLDVLKLNASRLNQTMRERVY